MVLSESEAKMIKCSHLFFGSFSVLYWCIHACIEIFSIVEIPSSTSWMNKFFSCSFKQLSSLITLFTPMPIRPAIRGTSLYEIITTMGEPPTQILQWYERFFKVRQRICVVGCHAPQKAFMMTELRSYVEMGHLRRRLSGWHPTFDHNGKARLRSSHSLVCWNSPVNPKASPPFFGVLEFAGKSEDISFILWCVGIHR